MLQSVENNLNFKKTIIFRFKKWKPPFSSAWLSWPSPCLPCPWRTTCPRSGTRSGAASPPPSRPTKPSSKASRLASEREATWSAVWRPFRPSGLAFRPKNGIFEMQMSCYCCNGTIVNLRWNKFVLNWYLQ